MSLSFCMVSWLLLTDDFQILKSQNRRGIRDQAHLRQSPLAFHHHDAQGLRNSEESVPTAVTCVLKADCHLAILGMSLTTAGETTTARLDRPHPVLSVEEMGIGRGIGHQSDMTVVTGGAPGHLIRGIEDTEAQARGPVARTMESPICQYPDGLQEMYRRCRFLFWRRLIGMICFHLVCLSTPY